MSNKIQCQFMIGAARQCLNDSVEGNRYCGVHMKKRSVVTPGGQKVFRSGGALDLGPRLAKERSFHVPANSAGIRGYPYTTVDDLETYRAWRSGEGVTLESHDILDRYPLDVRDIEGSGLTGEEIAIYDSNGSVWEFAKGEDGRGSVIVEESVDKNGVRTSLYQTKSGFPFAVISNQTYQIVRLDEDILNAKIISSR